MTFKEQIELYLKDLPEKWKDQLVAILCLIKDEQQSVDCAKVKGCETLTSLSNFTISGTIVSIKYTDEHNTQVTRSFDLEDVINHTLDDLDPNCLATPSEWNALTYIERLQLLIDSHCSCCGGPEIPFVNNTTALGCRTINATGDVTPPDNDPLFAHYIKFIGQSGQGNEYIEVPLLHEIGIGYSIVASGTLHLPPMTGIYKAIFFFTQGADYPNVSFFNSSNANISGSLSSGNVPSSISSSFNIADLDHMVFSCQNSG